MIFSWLISLIPGGRQNDPNLKIGNTAGNTGVNQPEEIGQMCYLKKLNELHPGINEEYRVEGTNKNQIFIAFATVNGTLFEGKGRAKVGFRFLYIFETRGTLYVSNFVENPQKKQAKKDLAMRILRQVHNFDLKVGQSAQEIVQSEEFTTNGIFADKISDAVNDQFYKLCEQQPRSVFNPIILISDWLSNHIHEPMRARNPRRIRNNLEFFLVVNFTK